MGVYQSPKPQSLPTSSVKKLLILPSWRGVWNRCVTRNIRVPAGLTSTEGRLTMTLDSIGRKGCPSFQALAPWEVSVSSGVVAPAPSVGAGVGVGGGEES